MKKTIAAMLLMLAPMAQADIIATYESVNKAGLITMVLLTDEPANDDRCNDGPFVKLAKISIDRDFREVTNTTDGCWMSDGEKKLSVIGYATMRYPGGYAEFDISDFEKTPSFEAWAFDELGYPIKN